MKQLNIPEIRLINQHLSKPNFKTPADTVKWFGAVQAQDYLGSLWAIGQRMEKATEQSIEQAISERTIVRSWPMRGTLHFTHAQDLRWMLKLLAPRVIKRAASRYRELELTDETFIKSEKVIAKTLIGGKEMTREELLQTLERNTVVTSGQRGIHILGFLAMKGLICFGSRSGKQFTFTLLDEWIPPVKELEPDHALAELTKRYFTSHGPATIKDFVWWSGLTITEAKRGLDMVGSTLTNTTSNGQLYWFKSDLKKPQASQDAFLLPAYDEFTVAYKDRSAIIDSQHFIQAGNGLKPTIVFDGRIIGSWKRELKKHQVIVTPHFFYDSTQTERKTLEKTASSYGNFLQRESVLL